MLALVLSVDDEALEGGVGSGELASSESESNGGLHFRVWWLVGWLESESMFQRITERR